MAKAKKIDVKNVILYQNQERTLKIKGFENEEIPFEDLSHELDEYIKGETILNIKFSKARKSSGKESTRKAVYKYSCPKCGKKFKSNEEELVAQCVDCGVNFEKED